MAATAASANDDDDQGKDTNKSVSWQYSAIHNVIAGGVAGAGSRMATAPLDLIRIRRQLTPRTAYPSESMLDSWRKIVETEGGVSALFRGNMAAVYLWVGYAAVQFSLYNHSRDYLQAKDPNKNYPTLTAFLAGANAGVWATLMTYPFDVCRTTFAARGLQAEAPPPNPPTPPRQSYTELQEGKTRPTSAKPVATTVGTRHPMPFSSLVEPHYCDPHLETSSSSWVKTTPVGRSAVASGGATITGTTAPGVAASSNAAALSPPKTITEFSVQLYRQKGVAGFYAGAGPAVFQIIPYMGFNFAIYDRLTAGDRRVGLSAYAGSISGAASKILIYPVDTVKRRLQAQAFFEGQHQTYTGMWDCIATVYRQEGIVSFYRGVVPSVMKTTISTGLTFALFRFTKNFLEALHAGNLRRLLLPD